MSLNFSTLPDGTGRYPDWVEFYNSSDTPVSLKDYSLSVAGRKEAVQLPDLTVSADSWLVLFSAPKEEAEDTVPDLDSDFSVEKYLITGRGLSSDEAVTDPAPFLPLHISAQGDTLVLTYKNEIFADSVTIPPLRYDEAYGRREDGCGDFSRLSPTPGKSNADALILREQNDERVSFSLPGGFYEGTQTLTLSLPETAETGSEIYYTLDGSEPDETSLHYEAPIKLSDPSGEENRYASRDDVSCIFRRRASAMYDKYKVYEVPEEPVDKAVVIRARSVGSSGSLGEITTETYFLDFREKRGYDGLPVVSVVADPEALFGYERGIYVLGQATDEWIKETGSDEITPWTPANYAGRGREWEREAAVALYDADRNLCFSRQTGIRIKGLWSRAFPQKSLNLYARKEYGGADCFPVAVFHEEPEHAVTLFSGGNDNMYQLEDSLAADLSEELCFASMHHFSCVLFLNGEFWGVMELCEKYDRNYFSSHYKVGSENVVMIKNHALELGEEKDMQLYEQLRYVIYRGEIEPEESYIKLCSMVDMESMLDYYAFRVAIGNTDDWPSGNNAMWRVRSPENGEYGDGKWRFILFDVNNTCMDPSVGPEEVLSHALKDDSLFRFAMENEEFHVSFEKRLKELRETVCSPESVHGRLEKRQTMLRSAMERWYERFTPGRMTTADYDRRGEEILKWFERSAALAK
ncbi:MAG: CotH kinase family protein [Lachnospiraceae bacterium]|nr:CotH kinase family protein [Lachnospiraceae bacterium]